jgi:hypothetical protein
MLFLNVRQESDPTKATAALKLNPAISGGDIPFVNLHVAWLILHAT